MNPPLTGVDLDRIGARELLDSLADGAYVTDLERRILFWSRSAARITGWPAEAVVGRTCFDNVLAHVDKDGRRLCGQEECPLHRSIVTGESSQEPLLVFAQHQDGHRIPVEVSVAPLLDRSGQVIGGIELFRDLTGMLEDLRRAQVIQQQALACPLPEDPRIQFEVRYVPEELVGGDYYRIEAMDPDHYALLVADVKGHGVASALYTMHLRSLWEEGRSLLATPHRFLTELNRRLGRLVGGDEYFGTAVLITLNARTGEFKYGRAGHPSPFLFRSDGQVARLPQRGPALGWVEQAEYAEGQDSLQPGETLLLFTDGAVEISQASGEDLGEAGLLRLLMAEGLRQAGNSLERIERRLLESSRQIRLTDDLTLVSVRR